MASLSTWVVVALSERGVCLDGVLKPKVVAHLCTTLLGVPEDRCAVETVAPQDVHSLSLHRTVKRVVLAVKRAEASATATGHVACLALVLLPSLSTAATRRCVLSSLSTQRSTLKTAWTLAEVMYVAERGDASQQRMAALHAEELVFRLWPAALSLDSPQHWTANAPALLTLGTHECGSHSPDGPLSVDDTADLAMTCSLWRDLSSSPWHGAFPASDRSVSWQCLFLGMSESIDVCSSVFDGAAETSTVVLRSVAHCAAVRWCCSGDHRIVCFVQGAVHSSGMRFTRALLEKHVDTLASQIKALPVLSWFSFLGASSVDSDAVAEAAGALPLPFNLSDAAILSRLCGIDFERSLLLVDRGACPWAEVAKGDDPLAMGVTVVDIRDGRAVDQALDRFGGSTRRCPDVKPEELPLVGKEDRLPSSLCQSPLRHCVVATGSRVRATMRWVIPADEIVSATVLSLPAVEAVCDVATLRLGRQYRQSKLLDGSSAAISRLSQTAVAASATCWSSNRSRQYTVGVICVKGHVQWSHCPCSSPEHQGARGRVCRHVAALCVTLMGVEVAGLPFDNCAAVALFRAGSGCRPAGSENCATSDNSQPAGNDTSATICTRGRACDAAAPGATTVSHRYVPVAPAVTEHGLPLHMLMSSSSKQPRRHGNVDATNAGDERKRRRAHEDPDSPGAKRKGTGALAGPSAPAIRRLTPFFFFMTTQRASLKQQPDAPQKPSEIARKLAEMWKALSPEERDAVAAECKSHNEEADRLWTEYRESSEYRELLAQSHVQQANAERRRPTLLDEIRRRCEPGAIDVAVGDQQDACEGEPESFGHRNPEWRRNDKGEWVCDWDSEEEDGGDDQDEPQHAARLGSVVRHRPAAGRGVADLLHDEHRSTLVVRRGHSGVETQATLCRSALAQIDEQSSDDDLPP